MNYPNTKFEIIDQSQVQEPVKVKNGTPLFMCCSTTDKGPEDLRVVTDSDFEKLYGKVSFVKHGQPQLQTAVTLKEGAQVLMKRIVSPDALLANTVIVAKVKSVEKQKVNDLGELLYLLPSGDETTDSTAVDAEAIMIPTAEIKYEAQSIAAIATLDAAIIASNNIFSSTPDVDGYKTYPLFVFTDVGRGTSNKKFRISTDFVESKRFDYAKYQLDIFENSELLETIRFSFDYDAIESNENVSLQAVVTKYSEQVIARVLYTHVDSFVEELETISGRDDLLSNDILFGRMKSSKNMQEVNIADASVSLSHVYGINLANGSNGSFTGPNTPEVETEMVRFFNGELDQSIYDLDRYKIDAIVDANYPGSVKRAIENLVDFREDLFFFRGLGFVYTYESIKYAELDSNPSRYCASNHLSYDIIDPFSKKQIRVTVGYSLSKVLVHHFLNGRHRPLAGKINEVIISDAIKGTENYLPIVTPNVNQKELLADLKVNYASYFEGELVVETQFTSQNKLTQLSYIGNVLAVQEVIKAIRTKCPKIRYSFIDGEDLETYKKDVQAVINKFTDNFAELTFKYLRDEQNIQDKTFKAALVVKFRNYAESEHFTIYTIN